jgi:hypothetical protein
MVTEVEFFGIIVIHSSGCNDDGSLLRKGKVEGRIVFPLN